MENFFANLIKHRLVICFAFLLVIVSGLRAISLLPIDAFPDLANNQVEILTDAPGLPPLEVEQLVTIPIESIMNGIPNVTQVRSLSKFGLSVVTVVFRDSVPTYFARQLVFERLASAQGRLPREIEPQLGPVATAMGEIYQYTVEGPTYTLAELKTLQDWEIKYQLRSVPGVAEVNTFGGKTQEYVVGVDPPKLLQYGITLQQLFSALASNNLNFGAGIINHQAEQYTVRGIGRVANISDIENIVLKSYNGTPIFVGNVAKVELGTALRQGASTKAGVGEVVTGIVMMLKGENSRDVIERVKERIAQINKSLPEGVAIKPFYDQSVLVDQTIHTVETNLAEGGLLVVAVLLLMLGNLRAALIVAATIPIAMMFSFIGMKALGITANIMSLGAIDFGMIVDGSIVMVENSLRNLAHGRAEGETTLSVVQHSAREMSRPILFGVLIIAVVYMPILALQGMEYKMFSPMVFTVCFALLGSMVTALTLVPVLCSFVLAGKVKEWDSFLLRAVRPAYAVSLNWCLAHKLPTIAAATAALLAAVVSLPMLGTEFVPRLEEGNIIIETRNLPSISLPAAVRVGEIIEDSIEGLPEIATVICRTGRPDLATDPMGVYQTDVYVMLKPQSAWRKGLSKAKLVDELRQRVNKNVPGASFNFTQLIAMRVDELVSGVRSDVAVKLFGEDMDVLEKKAQQIERTLQAVAGVTDLQTEKLTGGDQLLIIPDRERMARYGVNVSDIQDLVQTAIIGKPVSEVLEGRKRFALRVRFPQGGELDPEAVQSLLLETSSGKRLPLSQVAKVEINEGVDVVNREFGQRRIVIQCNVRNRDVGSFVKEAQQRLFRSLQLPSGYYVQWGGQFENQQRAMARLTLVLPASIVIIFLLLTTTFSSVSEALLVMLNVPFALIGGVVALWIRGMYLSVPASIGFIALFGVAVLNGVVLVSCINALVDGGMPIEQSLREGCRLRLRPVLMTAMVAALGFMPMALSTGAGAEVQKPLATVVIGGIVTSTLLTLLVLPVVYGWFSTRTRRQAGAAR